MKTIRRLLVPVIATVAALGCLFAGPVAQPLLATAGAISDVCANPIEQSCTRGVCPSSTARPRSSELDDALAGRGGYVPEQARRAPGWSRRLCRSSGPATVTTDVGMDRREGVDRRDRPANDDEGDDYDNPGSLAAISPTARGYVTSSSGVLVLDSATGNVLSSIPIPSSAVAITPDGTRIYLAGGTSQAPTITMVDAVTHAIVGTIPLSHYATQLELTPDGLHLYALAPNSRVLDIDATSNTVAGVIMDFGGPSAPQRLSTGGGRLYVATSLQSPGTGPGEGIAVIDIATRAFITKVDLVDPFMVEASTDGSRVWALGFGSPRLTTIDTANHQFIGNVPAGSFFDLAAIPGHRIGNLVIDQPAADAVVQAPFTFSGWAVDVMGLLPGPGVSTVHVWAFPADGSAPTFVGADYGRTRADVVGLYGPSFTNSGYEVTVRGLRPGAIN